MQAPIEEIWIKARFDGDFSELIGTKKSDGLDKEEICVRVLRGKLTHLEALSDPPRLENKTGTLHQDLIEEVLINDDQDGKLWKTAIHDVHLVDWEEDSTAGMLTGQGRRVGRIVGVVYAKLIKAAPQINQPLISVSDVSTSIGQTSPEVVTQIEEPSNDTKLHPEASQVPGDSTSRAEQINEPPPNTTRCGLCHWFAPLILGSIVWFFCTWWWALLTVLPLVVRCLLIRQKLIFFTPPKKATLLEPFLITAFAFGVLGVVIWTVFESCLETPVLALSLMGFLVVLSIRLRQCGLIWLVTAFWLMAMLLTCTGQDYDCLDVKNSIPNPISNLSSNSGLGISKPSVPNLNLPTLPVLSGGNDQSLSAGETQGQKSSEKLSENPLDSQPRSDQSDLDVQKQASHQTQDQLLQRDSKATRVQLPEVTGAEGQSLSKQENQFSNTNTAQVPQNALQREATTGHQTPEPSDSSRSTQSFSNQSSTVLPDNGKEEYDPEMVEKIFRDKFPHWPNLNEVEREIAKKSVIRDLENSGDQRQRTPTQIGLELPEKLLKRFADLWQDFQESLDRSFRPDREANEMAGLKTPTDSWNRISMDEAEKIAEQVFLCKSRDQGSDLNQVIYLGEGTLFDLNQAILSADADVPLLRLSRLINRYPDSNIMVIGHADKSPHREGAIGNLLLSEQRAQSVVDRLIEVGNVIPGRIMAFGAGDRYPILDTPEPFRGNRRVEVHIICPSLAS
jgi:outer membrane protein OmpA-like peptidoglycan-associated protein